MLAGNNRYTGDTIVQGGTLALTGAVAGNLAVWSGASFAGNGVIGGSLALLAGSTYQAAVGAKRRQPYPGRRHSKAVGRRTCRQRRLCPNAGQHLAYPHRRRRHIRQLRRTAQTCSVLTSVWAQSDRIRRTSTTRIIRSRRA